MADKKRFRFTPQHNLTLSEDRLVARFLERYERLFISRRQRYAAAVEPTDTSSEQVAGIETLLGDQEDMTAVSLSMQNRQKAKSRARQVARKMLAKAGFKAIRDKDIPSLQKTAPLVTVSNDITVHRVDEIAAELYEDFPWMKKVIEPLWRDLRLRAATGESTGFQPILLVGPPSVGKSYLAQRLAELLSLPLLPVDTGQNPESFMIAGMSRNWSNGTESKLVRTILDTGIANPVVIIDEIDKIGTVQSASGSAYDTRTALLGLLEPTSNKAWMCPYYGIPFDMSHVNWIATANSIRRLPPPLLSRMRIVHVDPLGRQDLVAFATNLARQIGLTDDDVHILETVIGSAPDGHPQRTLRGIKRMASDLKAIGEQPTLN